MIDRFEDLETWRQARRLVKAMYELTRTEALVRDFGLIDQLRRASVSIMSNVAEGFERSHISEKLQFYNVARSSAGEVRSLLYVIEDNYPTEAPTAIGLRREVGQVGQLVTGLIRSTEVRKKRGPFTGLLAFLF